MTKRFINTQNFLFFMRKLTPLIIPSEGHFIPQSVNSTAVGRVDSLFNENGGIIPIGSFLAQVSKIKLQEGLEMVLGFTQEDIVRLHPDSGSQDYIANGQIVYNGKEPAKSIYKVSGDAEAGYVVTKLE